MALTSEVFEEHQWDFGGLDEGCTARAVVEQKDMSAIVGGIDGAGAHSQHAHAHRQGDPDFLLGPHLETPDDAPGEEGQDNVHYT